MKIGKDVVLLGSISKDSEIGEGAVILALDNLDFLNGKDPLAIGRGAEVNSDGKAFGAEAKANIQTKNKESNFSLLKNNFISCFNNKILDKVLSYF